MQYVIIILRKIAGCCLLLTLVTPCEHWSRCLFVLNICDIGRIFLRWEQTDDLLTAVDSSSARAIIKWNRHSKQINRILILIYVSGVIHKSCEPTHPHYDPAELEQKVRIKSF